jgi:hypothetical protein
MSLHSMTSFREFVALHGRLPTMCVHGSNEEKRLALWLTQCRMKKRRQVNEVARMLDAVFAEWDNAPCAVVKSHRDVCAVKKSRD